MDNTSVYDNNYTHTLKTVKTIGKSITDGTVTFSNGTISGLGYPVDPQDAVTKGFVDLSSSVADPPLSVQYNDSTFKGSSNLLYSNETLLLNGTYTDGTSLNITDKITGIISNPVFDSSEIATKAYVDNFGSMKQYYIQSDTAVTYTPEQIANSLIIRNLQTLDPHGNYGQIIYDILPSASDFISALDAQVGNKYQLYFLNYNLEYNQNDHSLNRSIYDGVEIYLVPGSDTELDSMNSIYVGRTYMLDMYILVTDIITPKIKLIVNSCINKDLTLGFNTTTALSNLPIDFNNSGYSRVRNLFLWNVIDNVQTATNYSYTSADVKNQLVIRNPSANSIDILDHTNIELKYINQIMVIQNISGYTIQITASNMWNVYHPGTIEIPSNKQIHLSVAINLYPALITKGSYYTNGIHNTIGGTGTGLTVLIKLLKSKLTIISPGSGYEAGGNYSTINLTNPDATGLFINVMDAGVFGEITMVTDVANLLMGGYQVGDILQIVGGDNNAEIQLASVNEIFSYDIENLGSGYLPEDIVEVVGDDSGTGCTFEVGKILNLRVIGIMGL